MQFPLKCARWHLANCFCVDLHRSMPAPFRTASAIQKGRVAVQTSSVHVSISGFSRLCCCGLLAFIWGFFTAIAYLLRFESGDEL